MTFSNVQQLFLSGVRIVANEPLVLKNMLKYCSVLNISLNTAVF